MIKDFIINGYRGLRGLTLEELNKINIFVGPNNCGKTSILEAIILSGLFDDVDLLEIQNIIRRSADSYLVAVFPLFKTHEKFILFLLILPIIMI